MITSHDIARLCGVSRGTVDRVLNNRPNVKPETREAVLKVANEHGYCPNYIASSLSRKKTNTIGIVVFDLENPFFAQLVGSAEGRLRELGYFSYVTLTHKDKQIEADCIFKLRDRRVDGIIILPIGLKETTMALDGLPCVTVGNRIDNIPHIGIDEFVAGVAAASHIKANGYTKAYYIGPLLNENDENTYAQKQRYLGFSSILNSRYNTLGNLQEILPEVKAQKTAVFCSTDIYALKALTFFKEHNLTAPEDFGLMGFDNIDTLNYIKPRIVTVSVAIEDTGIAAAENIVALIESRQPDLRQISYEIIKGQSL